MEDPHQSKDLTNLTHGTSSSVSLLHRFQDGDAQALDRLWARYLPRLKRWAHGRLPSASRNHTSTDDLVQDSFVRSLAHLRAFKPRSRYSLFAYFRTIILNQIRDYARQSVRRPAHEELDTAEHVNQDPSPLEHVLGREALNRFEQAMGTLSEDDRQIVSAFIELRCTDKELAELFEKPSVEAARKARGRALRRLAEAMEALETGPGLPSSAQGGRR